MGDSAEHMEYQLAGGRVGVDLLFQADQADAALFERRHCREQFGE